MDTKGGRYSLEVGGLTFSGRAEAKIKPARATPENGVNQDGSGYRMVQPKLASIEMTFDRGDGPTWDENMLLNSVDVTFVEDDTGWTHYLTKAGWSGEPEINTKDGEVSGMKLESDKYRAARN